MEPSDRGRDTGSAAALTGRAIYLPPRLTSYGSVAVSTAGTPALIYEGRVEAVSPDY